MQPAIASRKIPTLESGAARLLLELSDAERFWCTSIVASELAASLAPRFAAGQNTARTAALLYNIGLLWLADALPGETHAALDSARDNPACSVSDCLKHHCGLNRREASLHLYAAWRLPAALIGGLANGTADSLARLVPLCESMATEVFDEIPTDQAIAADRDERVREAYAGQLANLSKIKELAATLF